jgi:hypothetical protein
MNARNGLIWIAGAMLVAAGAAAQQPAPQPAQKQERATTTQQTQKMYGYDVLTEQERHAYRTQMNAAKTEQERERIRNEHRELVQRRAKEQGVTVHGMAYGPGPGAGPGKGGGSTAGKGK